MNSMYNDIMKQYESSREQAQKLLETKKSEIYKKLPRIFEIDNSLEALSIELTRAIINNPSSASSLIEELHQKSTDLKVEKAELLASNNYPTDYLSVKYGCPACKDTGFIEIQKCNCLKQKIIDYAYIKSNLSELLRDQFFDNFDFEYYSSTKDQNHGISPKKNMQDIYKACLKFVDNFDRDDENFLFTGPIGVGKTFLSSCIAKELLDKGKVVYYQTAFKIFDALDNNKFNRDNDFPNKESIDLLYNADLLIIDDLGTEFINSYTSSEFFNILNSRLLAKKKTIISTNLSMDELVNRYSTRVTSRIWGCYKVWEFFGADIRAKTSKNM